jgi:alkanesulfonate monooxygenase SsuD/methylene tetrahydromethanopterin reductase-like flavin-dependent oxidoreductase (luciferase family)
VPDELERHQLSDFGVYIFPWGRTPPQPEEMIAFAREADELGFGSVHISYHLSNPHVWTFEGWPRSEYIFDPLVLLPVIARETKHTRLAINAVPLPLVNPYFYARYLAACDVLSHGRILLAAVTGWSGGEFQIAGVPVRERGRRTNEALDVITGLWTQPRFSYRGEFYEFEDVAIDPRPLQDPHPEIWLAGESEAAADRATRWGSVWLQAWPTLARLAELAQKGVPRAGQNGRRPRLAVLNYVVISEDGQWLREQIGPILQRVVQNPVYPDAAPVRPEEAAIIGDPQAVAQRIRAYRAAGVAQFVLDFNLHGIETIAFAREQMQRFVRDVYPLVTEATAGDLASARYVTSR